MALSRKSIAPQAIQEPQGSLFEREKERLIDEISTGFEELMTHTNVLNRKLEEVYGVGKEFKTVAALWGKFNALIRDQKFDPIVDPDASQQGPTGVPGTGGANFRASVRQ